MWDQFTESEWSEESIESHESGVGVYHVGEDEGGHNGVSLTAGIIVADVVGAGILGMPVAFAKFGWLLGSALLIVMLAMNVHVSLLMWKVRVQSPLCKDVITYNDLVHRVFSNSPVWQRRAVYVIGGFSQKSFIFGLMGLYLLSAGKGLGMIFYTQQLCLPQWALIGCAILLPIAATSRNMGTCQCLVLLNVLTLCGTVMIPLIYYMINGTEGVRALDSEINMVEDLSTVGVLTGLSTFTFGFTSQFMLVEIISEMKNPLDLPKAYVNVSAPFQVIMFMIAGLGGYLCLGNKVEGMLNENLPFGVSLQVTSVCMLIHMLISYLIKGVVLCKSCHRLADREFSHASDGRPRSWIGWVIIVVSVMGVSYTFANVVPFFGDAVDLLGASVTPICCFVIPILMFIRFYADAGEDAPDVSTMEWIVIALELLLAFILIVFGTASAVQTIMRDLDELGAPFACHCQGLWNTCECSGCYPGMIDLCHPGNMTQTLLDTCRA
eukprot:TRINITY_DN23809_c1_g2_i1.p1 TRINITY_DN23809_c1_g2~~TRINITY_DN23809_c1_g2_i1.p1  ORF type:complete len:494 (-),score=63.24 TRINITY_DN23809_c1_g2_i1:106-1587(-)